MRQSKIEKKVLKKHAELVGTSEIDAKVHYVKMARSLPTFGVHFFLVKVIMLRSRAAAVSSYAPMFA